MHQDECRGKAGKFYGSPALLLEKGGAPGCCPEDQRGWIVLEPFINDNFLLNSKTAQILFHEYARDMPIIDYHCHLDPKEIYENKKYRNITELWLGSDHYKWRAMRGCGIEEKYITGDAGDKEKFLKWSQTIPYCIGNPLYHWTHLELKRYFDISEALNPSTAEKMWDELNRKLQSDEFSARSLIRKSNVKVICTIDDPADSLEYHLALAKDKSFDTRVLPAFRPERAVNIEKEGFNQWLRLLSKAAGLEIETYNDFKQALRQRIEFFHRAGCRLSDHGFDYSAYSEATDDELQGIFNKAIRHELLKNEEINKYRTGILLFLAGEYRKMGWAMQFHLGTLKDVNQRRYGLIGPDSGFDAMGDSCIIGALSKLLNKLDENGQLPKTILYSINQKDNDSLIALATCFPEEGIPAKVQLGSGWWFNDTKDGMVNQMASLANIGLLSKFIGMLTDSRTFISYTRHEYFRRVLCNLLGRWVENGEAPSDMDLLGRMVQDICFYNAKNYFGF